MEGGREVGRVGGRRGGVDLVVVAYRGNADLLEAFLTRRSHIRGRCTSSLELVMRLCSGGWIEATRNADPVSPLSPREREVYGLICEGLSNTEIASRLFITEGTVKVHVQQCSTSSGFDHGQRCDQALSATVDLSDLAQCQAA